MLTAPPSTSMPAFAENDPPVALTVPPAAARPGWRVPEDAPPEPQAAPLVTLAPHVATPEVVEEIEAPEMFTVPPVLTMPAGSPEVWAPSTTFSTPPEATVIVPVNGLLVASMV